MENLYETYYKNNFYLPVLNYLPLEKEISKIRDYQLDLLRIFHKYNNVSVVKTRQIGASTILAYYISCLILLNDSCEYKKIVIFTPNKELFMNKLSYFLRNKEVEAAYYNKHRLIYNNVEVHIVNHIDQLRGNNPDIFIAEEITGLEEDKCNLILRCSLFFKKSIIVSSLGGKSDKIFKKWHSNIVSKTKTFKKRIILEKKNNILNDDYMYFNASFN
jgi:hypothetical protein